MTAVHPKAQQFNTDDDYAYMLARRSKRARQLKNERQTRLIVHADNARPHSAKSSIEFCTKLNVTMAPQPRHSPDRVPPDCFLFGHIKDKLSGFSFPSALHIHRAIK
jgi:transposase